MVLYLFQVTGILVHIIVHPLCHLSISRRMVVHILEHRRRQHRPPNTGFRFRGEFSREFITEFYGERNPWHQQFSALSTGILISCQLSGRQWTSPHSSPQNTRSVTIMFSIIQDCAAYSYQWTSRRTFSSLSLSCNHILPNH